MTVQARVHSGFIPRFGFAINYRYLASIFFEKNEDLPKRKILSISWKGKIPSPVGLEPTAFELKVEHASPLRHEGSTVYAISYFVSF